MRTRSADNTKIYERRVAAGLVASSVASGTEQTFHLCIGVKWFSKRD
jgi:hypothetical protein